MIEKIFIIAFIVYAIYYSMQEGEIFEGLGRWYYHHLPVWMHKPIFDCNICMTPWYGTALYFLLLLIPEWITIVLAAMGFAAMMSKLFKDD